MDNKNSIRRGLYIVAGFYLIYLGYKLFRGSIIDHELSGGSMIAGAVFSIVFIVFGAVFLILTFRSQLAETKEDSSDTAEEIEEKAPEEEAAGEEAAAGEKAAGEEAAAEEASEETTNLSR